MQPLGAGIRPTPRHLHRVVAEDRLLCVVTLPEANALAVAEINGGKDLHGGFWSSASSVSRSDEWYALAIQNANVGLSNVGDSG
jgi:hypothetical protein